MTENPELRADDLLKTVSGLGDARYDKTAGSNRTIGAARVLTAADLDNLYEGNKYAARIVDAMPRECTRRGWSVYASEGEESEPFADAMAQFGLLEALRERDQWARMYGGAAIVLDVDDGMGDPSAPLDISKVTALNAIRVVDRHELLVTQRYGEMLDLEPIPPGMMGEPQMYQLTPHDSAATETIHATRIWRQVGVEVSRRRRSAFDWWGDSVLRRACSDILNLVASESSLANIVEDFSTAVFSLKGLAQMAQSPDGSKRLSERMLVMNLGKSIVRGLMIDADKESYSKQNTPVSGLDNLFGKLQQSLAASTDGMPLDLLFGTSPSGLSSSNESGRKHWHDACATRQRDVYEPDIRRFCELMRATGQVVLDEGVTFSVDFAPLATPSEKEQAETRESQAKTDAMYWKIGVLTPAEIAQSRFGGVGWSADTRLMDEAEIAAHERTADTLPNDDPPVE